MARAAGAILKYRERLTTRGCAEGIACQDPVGARAIEIGQESTGENIHLIEVLRTRQAVAARPDITRLDGRRSKFTLQAEAVLPDLRNLNMRIDRKDRPEVSGHRRRVVEEIGAPGNKS